MTPSSGDHGSISPDTTQTVAHGSTATFTVTPEEGYTASVGGTCGGNLAGATYTTNPVTGACTVETTFSQNSYEVTPSSGDHGSISPDTTQAVAHGSTATFTVTPEEGYTALVGGTCGGNLAGTTYTTNPVTGACTVSATFDLKTYTVTYNANSATSGTAPDTQTKTHGQDLTLATNSGNLARTGYTFAGWNTKAGGTGTAYGAGAIYTANAPLILYAMWKEREVVLETATGEGDASLKVTTAGHFLTEVSAQTPPAAAPANAEFPLGMIAFSIAGLAADGECSAVVLEFPRNTAINSYYKYGKTQLNPADHWYGFMYDGETGAVIHHTASHTEITLHLCDGKRGDDDLTEDRVIRDPGGPVILTVPDPDPPPPPLQSHMVNTISGPGGSVSPALRQVNHGESADFTLAPDPGYRIDTVSGCGGSLSGSTYATGPVTEACTVTASFIKTVVTHAVSATSGTGGSVSPVLRQVNHGESADFTLAPDPGYRIDTVSGCGGSLSGTTYATAPVTEACTVTARFVAIVPEPDHEVRVVVEPDFSGVVSGDGLYASGDHVILKAVAEPCYRFEAWEEDGRVLDHGSTYAFSIYETRNLTAVFVPDLAADFEFSGDGNGDGIPDRLQENVVSLPTYGCDYLVTFESPEGTRLRVRAADNPAPEDMPRGRSLPLELFDLTLEGVEPGAPVPLQLHLPEEVQAHGYLVYGRTPENPEEHWYDFNHDGRLGATVSGRMMTLHFVASETGDGMPDAAGVIANIGGPALISEAPDQNAEKGSSSGCFIGTLDPFRQMFRE
ncbi:putative repeat protein (TIGR02543 family) [Desulfobotulus alkaliphilus]|uniref:Putative repeat protein (TIGR02543 family) n=1 Tax=Desulfobotulus alkaliphilus TaxID=622671 RepID=A0A562R9M4_9BACT|nr:choice-of-anchor U domain-containing protein [Desulfobotulus alkaliphilus]TWI65758.1 putative repeat protein (TIGR02543 family) [Desulfobotulus alkaliphilus]